MTQPNSRSGTRGGGSRESSSRGGGSRRSPRNRKKHSSDRDDSDGLGYLEMNSMEDHYARQSHNEAASASMLTAFTNAAKNSENIFEVVNAALEQHRVTMGLEELRGEVKTLRQKNMNLKMQLEEMEKMMDANIEDRERVIQQRNEQIKEIKKDKDALEKEFDELKTEKRTMLDDLQKKFLEERASSSSKISDLTQKLNALEEFKAKKIVWSEQEQAHEKEKKLLTEELEGRLVRLLETQKHNEIRWADDIRKQRENMETEVYTKVHKETSEENEKIRMEHHQMGLELKHQGILISKFLKDNNDMKEAEKRISEDLVLSNAMKDALLRKLKFMTKKLQLCEEKLKKANKINENRKKGVLSLEDEGAQADDNDKSKNPEDNVDTFNIFNMGKNPATTTTTPATETEIDANIESLKVVTDELQKHIESRGNLTADLELTKKYNKFMEYQVLGSTAGDIKSKLKSIGARTKRKLRSVKMAQKDENEIKDNATNRDIYDALASAQDAMKASGGQEFERENHPESDEVIPNISGEATQNMAAPRRVKTMTKALTPKFDPKSVAKRAPKKPEVGNFKRKSPHTVLRNRQEQMIRRERLKAEMNASEEEAKMQKFSLDSPPKTVEPAKTAIQTNHDDMKDRLYSYQRRTSLVNKLLPSDL